MAGPRQTGGSHHFPLANPFQTRAQSLRSLGQGAVFLAYLLKR